MRVDLHPRILPLQANATDERNADAVVELAASQGLVSAVGVTVEGVVVPAVRRCTAVVPGPLERTVDVAGDVVAAHEVAVVYPMGTLVPRPVLGQRVAPDFGTSCVVGVPG